MEKGKAELIIEKMRNSLEGAQTVPLSSGKVMVSKDDFILLLDELEELLESELKNYREVTDKRAKLINDAKKEAENILYEAEKSASRIRVTKRIGGEVPSFRQSELSRNEKMALRTANDIYAASLIYTDEMLTEVDNLFSDAYRTIEEECNKMTKGLKAKLDKISENREELMGSLNELSKNDRYSQILEIGQLLANELYHEREKAREREKEKSYQLEFKFDEEPEENPKPKIEINPDRTPVKIDADRKKDTAIPVVKKVEEGDGE